MRFAADSVTVGRAGRLAPLIAAPPAGRGVSGGNAAVRGAAAGAGGGGSGGAVTTSSTFWKRLFDSSSGLKRSIDGIFPKISRTAYK